MPAQKDIGIPTIQYEPNRVRRTLEHGLPSVRLDCRLSGSIDRTAGAAGDAVVQTEAVQRLISSIRILADDFDIIPQTFNLRELFAYHLMCIFEPVAVTQPVAATINAGNPSAFELVFSLHFQRPYLVNPADTMLPVLPVRNGLYIDVTWETASQGATTVPGTGALLSAGSDTYALDVTPTLEIIQVTAPEYAAGGHEPFAVPVMRKFNTRSWSAATTELDERFTNRKQFDALLFRSFRDDTGNGENTINEVSLESTDVDILDEVPAWTLNARGLNHFPGWGGFGAGALPGPGYLPFLAAAGGRLRSRINPDRFTDLRLVFDVDAPGGGNGVITVIQAVDQPWAGLTQIAP